MSLESPKYTVALAKAQGMLDETMALFRLWKPGMTSAELANRAIKEGAFARGTAKRIKDSEPDPGGQPSFLPSRYRWEDGAKKKSPSTGT